MKNLEQNENRAKELGVASNIVVALPNAQARTVTTVAEANMVLDQYVGEVTAKYVENGYQVTVLKTMDDPEYQLKAINIMVNDLDFDDGSINEVQTFTAFYSGKKVM